MKRKNFKDVTIPQMEPWFDEAETRAVTNYMKNGGFITEYKKTAQLEEMISKFTGAKYCLMVCNGTISLTLALMALDLKPGDEVLVPNQSMIATANAGVMIGIKPVLVDIDPKNLCLALEKAKLSISKKTKALIYVPLNGRSDDMTKVVNFCRKNKLYLIEDAAQALGSYWNKKHLGTFGLIGSFSFSVPKVITTGQGGALITNSKKLFQKLKYLKDFGRTRGGIDTHDEWGWNFKFTDLQAVIGIEQMKKLKFRLTRKKEIYKRYVNNLNGIKEIEFIDTNLNNTSPWFVDIYVKDPEKLAIYLTKQNIGTRRVYPAIHSQKIYQNIYKGKKFPVSSNYASKGLWLPSSSKLTNEQIDLVSKQIANYFILN